MRPAIRVRGVVLLLVPLIVLSGGVAQAGVPIQTVVAFNPAAGEFPEGVAVDVRGNAYVSLIQPLDEIRKIAPSGTQSIVAHFDVPGFGPLGLAVGASGDLYVAVSTFDPASRGVYRVRPDGGSTRLPGTDGILFPNGVALDARGNIYATDSIGGSVWRISPGGSAELWFQSPLITGDGSAGLGFPLGANGIAYRNHSVVVTNTEGARIVSVPVQRDGSAGVPSVVAESSALYGADGLALDVFGEAFVAVNPQSTLLRVELDGSLTTLDTAADGLDNPASLAFGTSKGDRKSLFMTNFSISSASPKPALLKVALGVPGQPIT
jgi:sugar lactone lactonase YvrE